MTAPARPVPWPRKIYSALTWLMQPLVRRKLHRRARREALYGHAVAERFGHYQPADLGHTGRGQWLWLHAVSLGETHAAGILLHALRQRLPGLRLLLTHGTATGREAGQGLLQADDVQVWQPWDTLAATRRFIQQFRPQLGVLLETEVWPNLSAACREAQVPLALASARLSDKSLNQALRLAWLARPAYQGLAAVWAQTEADAQRLKRLGAPVQGVFGNLKFDARPDTTLLQRAQQQRRRLIHPVVLLASSREGEESLWLAALQTPNVRALLAQGSVRWLIVPRHPQRFDAVADLLQQNGLPVLRRSQWPQGLPPPDETDETAQAAASAGTPPVWLGDSLGEMPLYYGLASVALMGGSFAPLGGQNLIEALACDCPVILGPHTFNFSQAAHMACAQGSAQRARNMAHALHQALQLVRDRIALVHASEKARRFVRQHQGGAQTSAEAIAALLRQAA